MYRVAENSGSGIPFYEVEHFEVTTKTYRQPYFAFTLRRQSLDSNGTSVLHQTEMTYYTEDRECADRALTAFLGGSDGYKAATAFEVARKACEVFSPLKPEVLSAENAVSKLSTNVHGTKTEWRTRAGAKRYINVDRSAMGTTSGSVTLSEKGFLLGAQASVESKAVESVLSTVADAAGGLFGQVPVQELFMERWGLDAANVSDAQKAFPPATASPKSYKATLKFWEGGRLYAVTKEGSKIKGFAISELATAVAASSDNAVKFSGSVTLPKK